MRAAISLGWMSPLWALTLALPLATATAWSAPLGQEQSEPVRVMARESDVIEVVNVEILNDYSEVADPESAPTRLVVVNQRVRFLLRCTDTGRSAIRMIRYATGQGSPSYAQTKPVVCSEPAEMVGVEFEKESWHSWNDAAFWVLDP